MTKNELIKGLDSTTNEVFNIDWGRLRNRFSKGEYSALEECKSLFINVIKNLHDFKGERDIRVVRVEQMRTIWEIQKYATNSTLKGNEIKNNIFKYGMWSK